MNRSAELGRTPAPTGAQQAGRTPTTRRRTFGGALWIVLVAVLSLALAASLDAPDLARLAIRAALVRSFGTPDVSVAVQSRPAPALWWGNIGVLSVAARSLRIGRLDVAAFEAILTRVTVDPGALYGRRELAVRSVGSGIARVTVTAGNLARLVGEQSMVRQVVVRLQPGTIMLDGTVAVFGTEFPASVAGHLVVRDARHLDLVVDRVTVMNGLPIPADVSSRLAESMNPVLDVGQMPFGLRLTKVTIGEGVLMLQAVAGQAPVAGRAP